jgi:peptidoglycan hydrolase-like protein with peptidoglycan-binding domain
MKKIIKLTEFDLEKIVKKVLKESSLINEVESDADDLGGSQESVNIEITNFNQNAPIDQQENMRLIQTKLKNLGYDLGTYGPNKNGVDGRYGKLTLAAIKDFQRKNGIKPTGWVGTVTAPLFGVDPMKGVSFVGKKGLRKKQDVDPTKKKTVVDPTKKKTVVDPTKKKVNVTGGERCIAISKEECNKISSTKTVVISKGSETRCSAYMVKCLSQYDKDLYGGNAWDVFNNVKGGGSVKYNAFTSGEVNWNSIFSELVKNRVGRPVCEKHAAVEDADSKIGSAVPSIVTKNLPSSPKVGISSLKLGDIVGLYHKDSGNKGMAFCQRALKRGLDNSGNVKDKDPFTFNSHVGFVGAIKNGVPVIIHNVHGTHLATPATQMLNKNSDDMIVWVVSDDTVASAASKNVQLPNEPQNNRNWYSLGY